MFAVDCPRGVFEVVSSVENLLATSFHLAGFCGVFGTLCEYFAIMVVHTFLTIPRFTYGIVGNSESEDKAVIALPYGQVFQGDG